MTPKMAARLAALATVRPPTCKPKPQREPMDGCVVLSGMLIPSSFWLAGAAWEQALPGLQYLSIGPTKIADVHLLRRDADDPLDGAPTPMADDEPKMFRATVFDGFPIIAQGFFSTLDKAQRFAVEWSLVTRWARPVPPRGAT